ncbi:MAG: pitrilysin family protein [Actinomycetota bacterium]
MGIERTDFNSGLRVVTERMPGVRSVTFGVWVATGSRDERPQIGGASHFLEHLLFKGTKRRSAQDIAQAFDAVGGDLNAFTAKETTCFYARVIDKHLPMAVEHMCDMIENSLLRSADLEAERQVILEEINMHEDTPDDLIHDVLNEALWPDHPLGRPVLGTVDSISAMTREQVRRFYKQHYKPANLLVVAAGNMKHERVIELLRSEMDTGRAIRRSSPDRSLRSAGRPPRPHPSRVVRRRPTEQAHLCLGTNGLARSDPDRFAFGVVNAAVGGGMSSRLFQEIREKRGLAYSVYSYHQMFAEAGLFAVYAGTTPAKAKEVLGLIERELTDVSANGLSDEELERGKGHMKGSLVLSVEDTMGRMSRLGRSEIAHGEILTVDEVLKRIASVTAEDAARSAARVINQPGALAVIGPFEQDAFADAGVGSAAAHHGGHP